MSRRKQSNPKPLKAGEEEEWKDSNGGGRGCGGGNESIKKEEDVRDAVAPTSPAPPPPAVLPPPTAVPLLRVNPALATDPALRVPQEPEQASVNSAQEEDEDAEGWKESVKDEEAGTDSGSLKRRSADPPTPPPPTPPPRHRQDLPSTTPTVKEDLSSPPPLVTAGPPVYLCNPCGIRFSSLSTLEAHQTYYCSHRMHALPRVIGGAESESEDVKSVVDKEETSGGESSSEPSGKAVRTGKQYKCPHCSYSADKKVSLNRHMRMHSASPGASERSASPQPAIDRYCQNCDIRFSSSKTFRAHKMHYCSTRHVVKQPKSGSVASPESPGEARPATPTRGGGSPVAVAPRGVAHHTDHQPSPPQPYLALPTNPILILPYSLIQNASLLPAPITGGLQHAPDTAYFLLPDGTLQPMATAAISSPSPSPTVRPPPPEKPPRPVVAFHSPPPQQQQQPLKPVVEKAKSNEQPSGSPLDLSCRRSIEKDVVVVMDTSEDEKENRLMVHNSQRMVSSPEHEDIICAPSIPLMLSTSSTCSSPSPAPLSPASSSSQSAPKRGELKRPQSEQSGHSNSPSPKSSIVSPSPQMKSPRRTPNGISSKSRDRHTPEGPSASWTKENNNINLQSLLLAAVSAQSQMEQMKPELQNLPFPPEFIPHLTAMYNSRFAASKAKSMPLPPGMMPPGTAGGGLPPPIAIPMASRSPAEFLNQASLLLTSEMALRLAAAQSSPTADRPPPSVPPPPPQVLVKQGDSKCQECNIVFYKLENYIAHKKHYCSARKLPNVVESSQDEKTPSPMASSPPQTISPPKSESTKSKSPIGNQIASTSKPGALYQFICAACGIKFTSYDNLTAHQTYYCPKRNPNEPDKARRCSKCKMAVVGDHQCSGSSLGWKCPCCPVVSPTASAAQKHMDTHSGVKAFLCTICRYKGNTLRGMRTHIRMHFDKRPAEINEEKYITCIVDDGASLQHEPPSPSPTVLVLDEEPVVAPPAKSALAVARLALPSTPGADKTCNGTSSVNIKQESSDEPNDTADVEVPVVAVEEDEYIEVEDVPVPPVKEEIEEKPSIKVEPEDDVDDKATNNNRQSPGVVGGVPGTPKYCETCDISFTYLSTFIAHKKFYCTGAVTADPAINSSSNNNNNNSSKRSAGTPVT